MHPPPRERVVVDLEAAEAALQALVAGGGLGLAAEAGRQFGQVDAAHLKQGQKVFGQEIQPGTVPGQVFRQGGLKCLDGFVHGGCGSLLRNIRTSIIHKQL